MELTIQVTEDIAHELQKLPNIDAFIKEAIAQALENKRKSSKWAKLVERVRNDPEHLNGYSEQLKKHMKEFRDDFDLRESD